MEEGGRAIISAMERKVYHYPQVLKYLQDLNLWLTHTF